MNGIRWFDEIGIGDVRSVGGKNASLGEMVKAITACGVRVPGGFAITAEAFCDYLAYNQLRAPIPDSFTRTVEVLARKEAAMAADQAIRRSMSRLAIRETA